MQISTRLQNFKRKVLSYRALDSLCIALIFCVLVYELPGTAIAEIAASFGLFNSDGFYKYRVNFAAFVIVVAGLNLLVNHRYVFRNRFFQLYILFFLYMLAIIWVNREMYGPENALDTESVSALSFYLPIMFKFSLFFLVGFYLPRLFKFRTLLLVVLFLLSFMIISHIDFETMGLDKKNYIDKKFYGNYLFIGDATSIIALICIAFLHKTKAKIILAIFFAVIIFFIGSRTSFAVFAGTVGLYFVVSFKPQILLASTICIFAIGIGLSTIDIDELAARNPRMFGVLIDPDNDNSVVGREKIAEYGWHDISNSIIMGNFGGQLTSGPPGLKTSWRFYMHNVLSYWRQFGILAFIIIVAFTTRCYASLWKSRGNSNDSIFAVYFLVSIFILVETAFSRSFAFPYAHIFFGLTAAINYTVVSDKKFRALAAQYYRPKDLIIPSIRPTNYKKKKRRGRRFSS